MKRWAIDLVVLFGLSCGYVSLAADFGGITVSNASSGYLHPAAPINKYITARIHEKLRPVGQETHVWVVSPLHSTRFKKNGAITEIQFLLIGEKYWNPIGIDINKIGRIEYELSAEPKVCNLPTNPQPAPASGAITGFPGIWIRMEGGRVVDIIIIKPSPQGMELTFKESDNLPPYSEGTGQVQGNILSATCGPPSGVQKNVSVKALLKSPDVLSYTSFNSNGEKRWQGEFQRRK